MTYGLTRIIHFFLLVHSIFSIPAAVLSFAFVSLDFISFIIQLVGGSYAGPTARVEEQMKGVYIYMGGIGLQQFFIFMFLGLAVKFHLMMVRLERVGVAKRGWKRLLWTLSLFLLCLTICIFFRLVEFSAGQTSSNHLQFHDYYFYILEAVPMFFAILCYNLTHPGNILIGPEAELPGLWGMFKEVVSWKETEKGKDSC
ncbi:RTA-like protein [Leptodontidium sp. 2 PMI_412]|nr:RTA-like protein [Leptodontidium sp. 2 PMI_412]